MGQAENGAQVRRRIEKALDEGKLMVHMAHGKWWQARRNGKTELWKTRPDDYSIPIKLGLKHATRLTPKWVEGTHFKIEE